MERRSRFDFDGWHYRGYLPHFEGGAIPQFITFRLADSLPISLFKGLKNRLDTGQISEGEYAYYLDRYLDRSSEKVCLKNREIAGIVREAIFFLSEKRYELHSWVIMPNHVHLLFTPLEGETLTGILHSLKSYSAKEANKRLHRSGIFWSREYFDRYMRDVDHFRKTKRYIEMNPVKAGLCGSPEEWEFGSAFSGDTRSV